MSELNHYFLGAHGRQDRAFERLLVQHLREHFAWRRSFHPEDFDAQGMKTSAASDQLDSRMHAELARLTEALKRSTPSSSPRYIGHMTSDLLMPGVLAQLVTTLYNPNNVSREVAPVTVDMERAVAAQLAGMIGYTAHPGSTVRAWGHLTGGGTVANIEALWVARSTRYWPVALVRAARGPAMRGLNLSLPADEWAAFNLPVEHIHTLKDQVQDWLAVLDPKARAAATEAIETERVERRGLADFHAAGDLAAPVVLVPMTAHYSWAKAMRLLGLGSTHLVTVPVTHRMRMDADALAVALDSMRAARRPVLAVVPVLGTTEFGTIDPVHEVVRERDRCAALGQVFWIHVDAAWGGYMASVFRTEDGGLVPRDVLRKQFRWFPSAKVYDAFAALGATDSVTVDPHKLGYLPFGVGALVLRDGRNRMLVTQYAPYIFDEDEAASAPSRWALEGSRPGAMAAAVCVTHRILPLHAGAFGELPASTIRIAEHLYDRLGSSAAALAEIARVAIPFEPDTNLVCIAVNPVGNRSVAAMNAFMRRLYAELSVPHGVPARSREFIASHTEVALRELSESARAELFDGLALEDYDADTLFLIRHTLMNPWLSSRKGDGDFIDHYCTWLADRVRALLA